ncbi:MAG: hypothetical protein O7C75_19660, partial [Verrucomicrobia bacterium]|nr:hypothetical protein [Verrucomicrobiota bacterium]
ADQHFWGAEIERLGVGEVLKKRRWPERLHTKLQSIEANPSIREKALQVQKILEEEDGAGNAIRALEIFVSDFQTPSQTSAQQLAAAQ